MTTDDVASDAEQYQDLLRKASPATLERIHQTAFEELTPEQRDEAFAALSTSDEPPADSSPSTLAKSATDLELRHPGELGRMFGSRDGDPGSGGLFATFVAYAIGSQLAFATLAYPGLVDDDGPLDGLTNEFGGFDGP